MCCDGNSIGCSGDEQEEGKELKGELKQRKGKGRRGVQVSPRLGDEKG